MRINLFMADKKETHPFITGRLCPIYMVAVWALVWYAGLVLLGFS